MPVDASLQEIELAVRQGVESVIREFTHKNICELLLSQLAIPGATPDELKEARTALEPALDSLPVGSSGQQIKTVVLEALRPLCQRIVLREEQNCANT